MTAASTTSLTALIVNWNRRAELVALLEDLRRQTEPPDETIVVDNDSDDGSPDVVARDFPAVRLIRLPSNEGLAAGRNAGIAGARGAVTVILDNDLRILDPTFLSRVRQSLDQHADCSILSFHCIDGVWSRPAPAGQGFSLDELEAAARDRRFPSPPQAFYDWFFWGGACAIRTSLFAEVGTFDAWFEYGGEEWDMAYRCHAAARRLMRDTSLWVIHLRSPLMRPEGNQEAILKNMIVAQSRYMPAGDLALFLAFQLARSALDAIRHRRAFRFLAMVVRLVADWPRAVARRRRPVSRETMRLFYLLRLEQPDVYPASAGPGVTPRAFYRARWRDRERRDRVPTQFVALGPALDTAVHSADTPPRERQSAPSAWTG